MRDVLTTALELVGFALLVVAAFLGFNVPVGVAVLGAVCVIVGVSEGRK